MGHNVWPNGSSERVNKRERERERERVTEIQTFSGRLSHTDRQIEK